MAEPWLIYLFACNREMQPFFCWLFVGGGGDLGSGSGSKFNRAARVGSGWVGSDNLGYGPGSGFSFEPVQTSTLSAIHRRGGGGRGGGCFLNHHQFRLYHQNQWICFQRKCMNSSGYRRQCQPCFKLFCESERDFGRSWIRPFVG